MMEPTLISQIEQLEAAKKLEQKLISIHTGSWEVPQPLTIKRDPEPYPLDALPPITRNAVEEVCAFVQAPISLVATCALGAMAIVGQAFADVKRDAELSGPSSLFLLPIADSGERKTTTDSHFTREIDGYEEVQRELAKPLIKDYEAAIASWTAKQHGTKEMIRSLAKKGETDTQEAEEIMRELERIRPEPPLIPRLLWTDVTPEQLAYGLKCGWPVGGMATSEGGLVLGSHGMGKDSVVRNLAQLNVLWDGGTLRIDRKTSESFSVSDVRLSISIQVQEAALQEFYERSGTLARGVGFFARFLLAWPESTQGSRLYIPASAGMPCRAAFNFRMAQLLKAPLPLNQEGKLVPPMLCLNSEAKEEWIRYYNGIEKQLCSSGDYYDIRDVASKSADNAARIAAQFKVFSEGGSDEIRPELFVNAARIALWHLNESRRFFCDLVLPPALDHAAKLDKWLLAYCKKEFTNRVGKSILLTLGPGSLREKSALDAAINILTQYNRVRLEVEGKKQFVAVNPALLTVA